MKRGDKQVDIPGLVREMTEGGAYFYFTPAGSVVVRNLGALPGYLRDAFYACNERELVRYLRAIEENHARDQAA